VAPAGYFLAAEWRQAGSSEPALTADLRPLAGVAPAVLGAIAAGLMAAVLALQHSRAGPRHWKGPIGSLPDWKKSADRP
jgi:hypothetical protein